MLHLPPIPSPVLPQVQLRSLQRQPPIQRRILQVLSLDACHQDGERVGIEEEGGQVGFRILTDELVGGMLEGDPNSWCRMVVISCSKRDWRRRPEDKQVIFIYCKTIPTSRFARLCITRRFNAVIENTSLLSTGF